MFRGSDSPPARFLGRYASLGMTDCATLALATGREVSAMADAVTLKIGSRRVPISNPTKVFYNAGKFTKLDVVNYYLQVAPFLLPHFRNRPVTLKRYPNGVHGEVFYEKDAPGYSPDWVKTFPVPRREGGPDINYILINDRQTLAWTANAAALELHPFLHRVPHLDRPTHVVFDLDRAKARPSRNVSRLFFSCAKS